MITASEYLRANTNIEQCETISLNNTNNTTCKETNWMYSIVSSASSLWTISPKASHSTHVFYVSGNNYDVGYVSFQGAYNWNGFSPAVYLNSDITLTGDGSQGNPYVIN